ncbi:hypothetical protein [Treponema sp.]|uniref:hypothetical protein n=1 Tax=Treponema sp. TaxID=166 RepID=UPI00257DD6D1|nr:hypothetical protein [Treponema sp.]
MAAPSYVQWFVKSSEEYKTKDGKNVEVWEFKHNDDETILKEWAWYFRQNYISDNELNDLTIRTDYEGHKKEFLIEKVFPDKKMRYKNRKLSDSIVRIGDFTEILIADFFQFCTENKYWIPRTRYDSKDNRNLSPKGTDIIGFKILDDSMKNKKDELLTVEVKANLGKVKNNRKLLQAIKDAQKDPLRYEESLFVMSKRFLREHKNEEAEKVKRFLNKTDNPFTFIRSASAIFNEKNFSKDVIEKIDTSCDKLNLKLIVFHGDDLITLCQNLYERAANEA